MLYFLIERVEFAMRKYLLLLIPVILTSCDVLVSNYGVYGPDLPEGVVSRNTAWEWVSENIEYTKVEEWQGPNFTYSTLKGDCVNYAMLLGWFLYDLGYTVNVVVYENGSTNHCILQVNDVYIEPQTLGKRYSSAIIAPLVIETYTYSRAFSYCSVK